MAPFRVLPVVCPEGRQRSGKPVRVAWVARVHKIQVKGRDRGTLQYSPHPSCYDEVHSSRRQSTEESEEVNVLPRHREASARRELCSEARRAAHLESARASRRSGSDRHHRAPGRAGLARAALHDWSGRLHQAGCPRDHLQAGIWTRSCRSGLSGENTGQSVTTAPWRQARRRIVLHCRTTITCPAPAAPHDPVMADCSVKISPHYGDEHDVGCRELPRLWLVRQALIWVRRRPAVQEPEPPSTPTASSSLYVVQRDPFSLPRGIAAPAPAGLFEVELHPLTGLKTSRSTSSVSSSGIAKPDFRRHLARRQ